MKPLTQKMMNLTLFKRCCSLPHPLEFVCFLKIYKGVPQGSMLGPLFLPLFICWCHVFLRQNEIFLPVLSILVHCFKILLINTTLIDNIIFFGHLSAKECTGSTFFSKSRANIHYIFFCCFFKIRTLLPGFPSIFVQSSLSFKNWGSKNNMLNKQTKKLGSNVNKHCVSHPTPPTCTLTLSQATHILQCLIVLDPKYHHQLKICCGPNTWPRGVYANYSLSCNNNRNLLL